MPTIRVRDTELYYEDSGGSGEVVVFSHGLLWSGRMFDAQVAALRGRRYRCVVYDHRGQGQSAPPDTRAVSIETCTEDAIALIEALSLEPVHFVGLSMGGFVGLRIAARRPELVRSLTLMETTAEPEPAENVPKYRRLALVARWLGLSLVAAPVMKIMFSRTFLEDPARAAEREQWRTRLLMNRRDIVAAVYGVVEREGCVDLLPRVLAPTLILVGDEDVATVPAKAEFLQKSIPGSILKVIPGAGHSSSVEQPERVNAALRDFLDGMSADQGEV